MHFGKYRQIVEKYFCSLQSLIPLSGSSQAMGAAKIHNGEYFIDNGQYLNSNGQYLSKNGQYAHKMEIKSIALS